MFEKECIGCVKGEKGVRMEGVKRVLEGCVFV